MIKINKQKYSKKTNKKIQSHFPPSIFKGNIAVETFHIFPVAESVQNKMHGQRQKNNKPGTSNLFADSGANKGVSGEDHNIDKLYVLG